MTILRLKGTVQNYAWGATTGIAELLGEPPSELPEAELWMGAHRRGPSRLANPEAGCTDLAELLRLAPDYYLGEDLAEGEGELPFLFKVLAVARPLSLQAHPNRAQAATGFEHEEDAGVPLDAPERNYKDGRHKPELIYALSPFSALSGFRTREECQAMLRAFGCGEGRGELPGLLECLNEPDGLEIFFSGVFELSKQELANVISRAVHRANQQGSLPAEARALAPWLARLASLHPHDPGVICAMLLHVIELAPGQAMYLPAGNLHAYLHGTGLELMASSDNVLRGGLTSKHVDLAALTAILRFEPFEPEVMSGERVAEAAGPVRTTFKTAATEFELSTLELRPGQGSVKEEGPQILLILEGEVELSDGSTKARFGRGEIAFGSARRPLSLWGSGVVARAALPRPVADSSV